MSLSPARRVTRAATALTAALAAATLVGAGAASAAPVARHAHHASTEQSIANALLSLLNRERAENKRPALTMDSHLISSAHAHNLAMANKNLMSHQVSGESSLGARVTDAGYKWSWAGENIGWNSEMDKKGVLALEQLMYHEQAPNDGHRVNILAKHFTNVGVDVYMDTAHNKVWLTTDFGKP